MTADIVANCARCGAALPSPEALACPRCGALVHADELKRLAAEAQWQAQYNPARAAAFWEEALKRLPPESRQYAAAQAEIAKLRAAPPVAAMGLEPGSLPVARQDPLGVSLLKTGISMLISIVVYRYTFGWAGAIGFVLLILIHELGHVVANLHYGLPASAPIFIPYVGAVINLRGAPANARVEAVIGIAGPVAGALASFACFGWYMAGGPHLALTLSWFGFMMNLFNLLPVPPLDGGRVAAAISPWIWVIGLAGMGMMLLDEIKSGRGTGILLIILIIALPRIIRTLKPSGRSGPYYAIGKVAPVVIGISYLALLGLLAGMQWYTAKILPPGRHF